MLSRPDPLRDTLAARRATPQGVVIGSGVVRRVVARRIWSARPSASSATCRSFCALLLSVLLIVFGSGPGLEQRQGEPRARCSRSKPSGCCWRCSSPATLRGDGSCSARSPNRRVACQLDRLPRLDHVLPVVAGVGAALVLFFFQKDLGPALLLSLMFLSLFAVARGGVWLAGAGLATLVARLRRRLRAEHLEHAGRARRRCGNRPGTTRCAAAIRSRRRCGDWRPARSAGPGVGPRTDALRARGSHRSRAGRDRRRARLRRPARRRPRCSP